MKNEARVLMATGCWVDYVAFGDEVWPLMLMTEKVEH